MPANSEIVAATDADDAGRTLANLIAQIVLAGLYCAGLAQLISYPLLKRVLARAARRSGQQYRDIFPEIHGSEREARREAARDRGLL